jgi:hypothetical protein
MKRLLREDNVVCKTGDSDSFPPRIRLRKDIDSAVAAPLPPASSCERRPRFQLLTSWYALANEISRNERTAESCRNAAPDSDTSFPHESSGRIAPQLHHMRHLLSTSPAYAAMNVDPDAVMNTGRYLYFHQRCGIYASVRGGKLVSFVPFANPDYSNDWSAKVRFMLRTGGGACRLTSAVQEYAGEKARTTRRPKEQLLPTRQWWLNGAVVCNVMPDGIWGSGFLQALHSMLTSCEGMLGPHVHADFFINKRDHPQLCKVPSRDPYAAFVGRSHLTREIYHAHVPVLSFYTGCDMADIPLPPTEDWVAATHLYFDDGPGKPPTFTEHVAVATAATAATATAAATLPVGSCGTGDSRLAKAVFRGSATGQGIDAATNARIALLEYAQANADVVDVALTGGDRRDKVVCASDDAIVISHGDPARIVTSAVASTSGDGAAGSSVVDVSRQTSKPGFMTLDEQNQRFKFVLYVDGNSAASRYGTLMHSDMVICRVETVHAATKGHLWLWPKLSGLRIAAASSSCLPGSATATEADHGHGDHEYFTATAQTADGCVVHDMVTTECQVSSLCIDHMIIDATLANLRATILWLRHHSSIASAINSNAQKKAPSAADISLYLSYTITAIAEAQKYALTSGEAAVAAVAATTDAETSNITAPLHSTPSGRIWFTAADKRYSRIASACSGRDCDDDPCVRWKYQ